MILTKHVEDDADNLTEAGLKVDLLGWINGKLLSFELKDGSFWRKMFITESYQILSMLKNKQKLMIPSLYTKTCAPFTTTNKRNV